jgi:chromosome segregation ATPase
MAANSNAIGNKLSRMALATAGAKKYVAKLPQEAQPLAVELGKLQQTISDLNAQQEGLKAELAKTTKAITDQLKQGDVQRAKIVRLAEATFGPKSIELKEFRPATEGKVAK